MAKGNRPGYPMLGGTERTTFELFRKQLRCHWKLTVHNGAYLFILLLPFQLSFFFWSKLRLFLLFPFAFIFTSFITHASFSGIENECSSQVVRSA